MKKTSPSVSLGKIAEEAGVTRMTVSYALRNHPRISKETRDRIQTLAKRLGYVPDARVAMRMAGVREAKQREMLPIAWLNTDKYKEIWHTRKWLSPFIEGARQHCLEMGYKLDEIWLKEPGMTARRISSILYHRGIQGVIIAPCAEPLTHLRLNWKQFSCVGLEKAILAPRLHRVTADYHYNMMLVLKLLRRFGYRRIGAFMQQLTDRRSSHAYQASLEYFHSQIPSGERIKPLFYRDVFEVDQENSLLRRWLKEAKPDVVVGHHAKMVKWIEAAGYRVPEDIGVVHLALEDDCVDWAGIWQRKREIGAGAAELAISLVQNNRFGLPQVARDTLIPGYWKHGRTLLIPKPNGLRKRAPEAAKKTK